MRASEFLPLLVLPAALAAGPAEPAPGRYDPVDRYEVRHVEGWTVLVNKAFLDKEPELAGRTLRRLGNHLERVADTVPGDAVEKLRSVRIWVEEREGHHPCMAYHPDPGWLKEHDMNPEKAGSVEIADARNFLKWTREQPWMVLHELAHAFHHKFLDDGFQNPKVASAYRRAVGESKYASVLHYNGREVKAYALTNPMEYFAEASEAFFGTNDFYPFVHAELHKHDPEIETVLKAAWGVK